MSDYVIQTNDDVISRALIGIPVQIRFETNPFSGQLASTLQCTKCKCYVRRKQKKNEEGKIGKERKGKREDRKKKEALVLTAAFMWFVSRHFV